METPEEILFRSTGHITISELTEKYGELGPGDIVFKMAEHKNFDAAKAEFDTWEEMEVFDMQYYLTEAFPHKEWVEESLDSYIAHCFAMKLVEERNNWPRTAPGQPASQNVLTLKRLAGILPHIDIGGTDFTIDWRLRELRETDKPWNKLNINYMELSPKDDGYLSFYHVFNHELYQLESDLVELPAHVMLLEIPNEMMLDPVAVSRENGLGELALLREFPIREVIRGKLISLRQTALPQIVAQNAAKLQHDGGSRRIGR
ncbi:hypothetical protein SAMN05192574_105323 [Mucilaginibacter gossypiicola]|uniref:Uncharacterized protein n=1 Tax=Mucilaginibacter gossypiicola TaxID=551995 RepID=A0A1H8LZY4_9SPHI|nr:hypothetical protein [Mucilaginibacter gossypiicola]SEO10580.1 hypothetical protein SAMN05192574_105323 [Mucilaginibacter gossypiicola]